MAATGELLRAYLIVGTDELKRKRALERLRAHVPPDFADFNLDELDGSALDDPSRLMAALEAMPFGADFRLVIVRAADALPKPVSEAVVSYLKDPNPACVLCLEAERLAKGTRLYKAVSKIGPKAVVDCAALKRWELPPYVVRLARARGLSLASDAAEELVARCGDSTVMLERQVVTLGELLAPRTTITRFDVEANVAQMAEVSPWAFADAVCERNVARALTLYHAMRDPSLVFLHSVLTSRLRELVCAKSLAARGSSRELAHELGRQAWQVKNHTAWARLFTQEELLGCLGEAAACERALKGSGDSKLAFTRLVVRIATPRA